LEVESGPEFFELCFVSLVEIKREVDTLSPTDRTELLLYLHNKRRRDDVE
jgi:hypothetical protein